MSAASSVTSDQSTQPVPPPPGHRWDFDVLRILAILGVLAIHIFGLILGHEELRGTATWYFALIIDIGSIWCVPVFVMISGALLLAPRAQAAGPGAFLRKRAVRLLPALVFWHFVYLFVVRQWLFGQRLDPAKVLVNIIDAKVYTALYFLWLILGLYLLAPVLASFINAGPPVRAKIVAVIACSWTVVVYAIPGTAALLGSPRPRSDYFMMLSLWYVGLFVAGFAWREAQERGLRFVWTGALAVVLLGFGIWQYDVQAGYPWLRALTPIGYVTLPTVVASVCLFICVIDLCARWEPPAAVRQVLSTLGAATFGVFLVHLLIIALIREWLPHFYADPTPVAKTLMYLLVVFVSFAISLVARRIPVVQRVF